MACLPGVLPARVFEKISPFRSLVPAGPFISGPLGPLLAPPCSLLRCLRQPVLSGLPEASGGLKTVSTESRLYAFEDGRKEDCIMSLPLPEAEVPWTVLLKLSCLEGNELAAHTKHYGMKVVWVCSLQVHGFTRSRA